MTIPNSNIETRGEFQFNKEKNLLLKTVRGVGFNDVITAIENGGLIRAKLHSNKKKYANQKILVVRMNNYIYSVPCVMTKDGRFFLKTVYPSRALKKMYEKK